MEAAKKHVVNVTDGWYLKASNVFSHLAVYGKQVE